MARNDIDTALRDGIDAAERDRPDFNDCVRLATSHLVEALESLNAYSQESPDVPALIARIPVERRKHLTTARGVVQKVGAGALGKVRNNTFHVPSPQGPYVPSSDEQLRKVLTEMGRQPCLISMDHRGNHPVISLSFADDAAFALAFGSHASEPERARRQFETASEGAVAFTKWVEALLIAYLESVGGEFGEPEEIS